MPHLTATEAKHLLGHTVGGFTLESLLGEGGMGAVYLAAHPTLGIQRAIKVISSFFAKNQQARLRFRREAMAMSRVEHPNIVQVLDYGQLPNHWLYLAMEYVDGRDLDTHVEDQGPMSLPDALLVVRQLAAAAAHLHSLGIVHRDLKPGNIVMRAGDPEHVKIIDFGLALLPREQYTRLTADRQIVGSPQYMSPEQALGGNITAAADVYAIGGIAYFLLTGGPVFPDLEDAAPMQMIFAQLKTQPAPVSELRPSLRCPRLDEVLMACLEKRPRNRPTAAELMDHIEHIYRSTNAPLRPKPVPPVDEDYEQSVRHRLWGDAGPLVGGELVTSLSNQLTAVMLELAATMVPHRPSEDPLARYLSQLGKTTRAIEQVELELALAADGSDAHSAMHEADLVARVEGLRAQERRHLREVYGLVIRLQTVIDAPEVGALARDFQALVDRFRAATDGGAS